MKKSTSNLILWVGLLGAVGVGGFVLFKRSQAAKEPAAPNRPVSNPPPPPQSDDGIFGSGISANDIVSLVGLF